MKKKEIVKYCLDSLARTGVQKAQCSLDDIEKRELNVEHDELSLFRTTFDTKLNLTAILDQKRGTISINKIDIASIDKAVVDVVELAGSSEVDSANDISEFQPAKEFSSGPEEPQLDLMYDRLKEFLRYAKENYPRTILENLILDFTTTKKYFQNLNGVDFVSKRGIYDFMGMFATKEGKKTSSFNYSGFSSKDLSKNIESIGSIDTLLKQSSEQLDLKTLPQKFIGQVIISPDCLGDFVSYITNYLHDYALITGTSIFKNKLNESIADSRLTLCSKPVSEEIARGYFITDDGFEAQNSTIIDKGILRTFLLSLYGSKKTGKPKAVNSGGAFVIEAGDKSFHEMAKSIEKGILLCRFSGGTPSDNGDFSGVAKNSYYIENGEICFPLNETMISGNLGSMLENIIAISEERIDFGYSIYPWVQVSNITVSGK